MNLPIADGQTDLRVKAVVYSLFRAVLPGALACGAALLPLSSPAGGTVTNCTETAFRAALSGGGDVIFNSSCALNLAGGVVITNDTRIDAGTNRVLLGGSGPVFLVNEGAALHLAGITLTNCFGTNASGNALYISQNAAATLTNCILVANRAKGTDGAAGVDGTDISWSRGTDGTAGGNAKLAEGGAIYNLGSLELYNCTLATNTVTGGTGGDGGNGGSGWSGGYGGSGGMGAYGKGGAIYNSGSLLASNCSFIANSAVGGHGGFGGLGGQGSPDGHDGLGASPGVGQGAAIYSLGSVTIVNCTFAYNTARGGDAGDGGTLDNNNGSDGLPGGNARGAGLWNLGDSSITNSTFFGNKVTGGAGGYGGNGWNAGRGGDGGEALGGGIFNRGNLVIVNATVTGCGAYGGTNGIAGTGLAGYPGTMGVAGGGDLANNAGTALVLKNSIVAAPLAGGNIYGTYDDAGNNVRSNPVLGALANNGGPTLTIAPLTGSPAVNAGDATWAPPFDQRGVVRPLDTGLVDIGAVEGNGITIVTNPASLSVTNGARATFSVTASGESPIRYSWLFNGTTVTGATNATYTVTNVTPANVGIYTVAVSNAFGGAISLPAQLSIVDPVVILSQPASQTVFAGTNVSFSVTASGVTPFTYQWRFNGTNLSGATTNPLVLLNVQTNNAGSYSVVVSNAAGSATSTAALLVIAEPVSLSSLSVVSNAVSFSFNAQTNVTYVIERAASLADTNWVPWLTNTVLANGWITNQDLLTNGPSGFYRLRLQ